MADVEVRTSGAHIRVSQSDRIVVRIPENATTGYQWSVTEIGETLEVKSSELLPPGQIKPGAAGERIVRVRPRRPGKARIALDLKRQWEQKPIDHFEVEVNVTD
jgi:inhibitor of cysteine peptidase